MRQHGPSPWSSRSCFKNSPPPPRGSNGARRCAPCEPPWSASQGWQRSSNGWGRRVDLKTLTGQWSGGAAKLLQGVLAGSIAGVAGWLIMFFVLFFFLRDRDRVLRAVERFLPLTRVETQEVFDVAGDTIHATVWGTLAVGLVQGTLGGLVFWWLGLPAPLLWGAVMALLSVLPVLGAAIVWITAVAYFALQGQWLDALFLAAFGTIVIGLIDNLIYPLIVQDRLHLCAVPVLVSIIGGLIVFGASGIVLGPLLLAVTDCLMTIWRRHLGLQERGGTIVAARPAGGGDQSGRVSAIESTTTR